MNKWKRNDENTRLIRSHSVEAVERDKDEKVVTIFYFILLKIFVRARNFNAKSNTRSIFLLTTNLIKKTSTTIRPLFILFFINIRFSSSKLIFIQKNKKNTFSIVAFFITGSMRPPMAFA